MGLILCLETSTKTCSVALAKNGTCIAHHESTDQTFSHAESLTLYIEHVLAATQLTLKDIDAVAVSKGPGSFTGLRIGVSTAKGLCYALDKQLLAIDSLHVLAATALAKKSDATDRSVLLCPMIDARRMEVYCTVYNQQLEILQQTEAKIIDAESFADILEKQQLLFFGDGAEKCRALLDHQHTLFMDGISPSAQFMAAQAEKLLNARTFEDLAYFEPYYLKDFVGVKK